MQSPSPVNILLVDDREDNLLALNAILRSSEYCLVNATSGAQALECLAERDFAVILLDVQMPGMDGLETARRVRRLERSANTPIILVTGIFPDEEHIRLGYEVGAVDFVSKPFDPRIMKCKVAVFADLFRKTEKIRMQEKLLHEASESRFRTLFEQSPLGIQLCSTQGDRVERNGAWERIWGTTEPQLRSVIDKALAGESSELPPAELQGKWVESSVYPVRNEQGAIREVAVIVKDVSGQKQAEEQLRRSRDQLRVIFEHVADGIIVFDQSHRCIYANDPGAMMTGFPSAQALLGRSAFESLEWQDVFDDQGVLLNRASLPTSLAFSGDQPSPERILRIRDRMTGKERWLVVSSRPVLDEDGKPYLAVSFYRDITGRRRGEAGERFLADATAILASSLDHQIMMAGISGLAVERIADWCRVILADSSGAMRVVAANHSEPGALAGFEEAARWLALSAGREKSAIYADLSDPLTPRGSPEADRLDRLKEMGVRSLMVVPIRVRDKTIGKIWLAITRSGRQYDSFDLALAEELGRRAGMAVDNALLYLDAETQREHLQKAVHARDEFISIASHELKTPVTSLILHAEMAALQLQRRESMDALRERIERFVAISGSQIDRLSRLIEEMLDVSRIANGKLSMEMEPVDFPALVRGVTADFSEQFREAGSLLEFEISGPVQVRCDRYRIEQVVTNLLTNAMKYGQGKPIHISVTEEGDRARLVVRDQGIGISQENHHRIFERFERAVSASAVSGLGLGLYIVKNIVTAHGGEIRVESELGQGAVFVVELPKAEGSRFVGGGF